MSQENTSIVSCQHSTQKPFNYKHKNNSLQTTANKEHPLEKKLLFDFPCVASKNTEKYIIQMNLELNRVDYCFVGTNLRNSLKLLPNTYKEQQQVVVGDQDGVLQLFSIKKNDLHISFKTLPMEKITALQLGGSAGAMDKIFVAMENKVLGFTKKKKLFFQLEMNSAEPIRSMFVTGVDLFLCGNHVYSHFRETKEIGTYLCGDTIVDVVALCPNNTSRIISVLACSGRVLRLLEHSRVRQTIELDSVPTVLHVPQGLGDKFICGFADGKIVMYRITHVGAEVKEEILVPSSENTTAVTTIDTFDLSNAGKVDLLVGRRDGTVQVFSVPSADNEIDNEIREIFCDNYQESISSIQGGCVGANGYTEIVVSTYTGRVFGLTTQQLKLSLSDNNATTSLSLDTKARIDKLKAEVEDLQNVAIRARDRYKESTQLMSDGISAIPMLQVNDSMILSKEDASYNLSIEIPAPIEFVLLQSDVPIKLLDVDKNSAVISFSKCSVMSTNQFLATYRCQIDTNRVDLKLRTIEGQHGTLSCYITPSLQPKVSQMRKYIIRPLSMHMRAHSSDETRPYNTLSLKGSFSQAEMHNWISYCIPEVPEKNETAGSDKIIYNFQNVFSGTTLQCEYCKGQAEFKTENITTLSILKDVITKNATKKRITLEILTNINEMSIGYMIKLIEPRLIDCNKNKENHKLLLALMDLDIRSDDDLNCLCPEYKQILSQKEKIMESYKSDIQMSDQIEGLLTDCFIDRFKLKGMNVKSKIPDLVKLIQCYDYNTLVEFFVGHKSQDSEF